MVISNGVGGLKANKVDSTAQDVANIGRQRDALIVTAFTGAVDIVQIVGARLHHFAHARDVFLNRVAIQRLHRVGDLPVRIGRDALFGFRRLGSLGSSSQLEIVVGENLVRLVHVARG